jgi:hypothetical protein
LVLQHPVPSARHTAAHESPFIYSGAWLWLRVARRAQARWTIIQSYNAEEVMMMADEITCTVEFTEGAIDRITDAFVDLYYGIKDGIYEGPLPPEDTESNNEDKTA